MEVFQWYMKEKIDEKIIEKIPFQLAKRHQIIPIEIKEDQLVVAMVNPHDIFAIDDIQLLTGMKVIPVKASIESIRQGIEIYYDKEQVKEAAQAYQKEYEEQKLLFIKDTDTQLEEAPIVKLVDVILKQGTRNQASDIHIEPCSKEVRIRYRINGILKVGMTYSYEFLAPITGRIKVMAGLDIMEHRRPQDGKLLVSTEQEKIEMRVSIMPTIHGEKTVLRMIRKETIIKKMEALGLTETDKNRFQDMLHSTHGMILATGPTGSGKSTTLYAILHSLNQEQRNVVTVEDPVELVLDGANQIQVNPKIDLNFASTLRYILRQDPDIIMIGEIRDKETAQLAIQASLTGHLVLSTLHTNDACGAIARLMEMGIDPFLLGNSLIGIVAQRLVQKLCPNCRSPYKPSESELNFLKEDQIEQLHRSNGCTFCQSSSYEGRVGIFEVMPITKMIRQHIHEKSSMEKIKELAISEGMTPMEKQAKELVLNGVIGIDEMIQITYSFEM